MGIETPQPPPDEKLEDSLDGEELEQSQELKEETNGSGTGPSSEIWYPDPSKGTSHSMGDFEE